MSSNLLNIEIITPQGIVFKGNCYAITLPTLEGEIVIAPSHEAIVSNLVKGFVKLLDSQLKPLQNIEIEGGFAKISNGTDLFLITN